MHKIIDGHLSSCGEHKNAKIALYKICTILYTDSYSHVANMSKLFCFYKMCTILYTDTYSHVANIKHAKITFYKICTISNTGTNSHVANIKHSKIALLQNLHNIIHSHL